jgi:probable HAF family extracellular repeat protein
MKHMVPLAAIAALCPGLSHAAAFEDLGSDLSVAACSADGNVVVGTSAGGGAFRWTPGGGLESIGGFRASDVSEDGTVIVGVVIEDGLERAASWTAADGWRTLGDMAGGESCDALLSSSWGTNEDGSIVVGLGWVATCRANAFRWDAGTGIVDLGSTVDGRSSRANDVAADGSIIIGWQDQATGFRQGASWVDGVQSLFVDGNGDPVGEAQASTPDGSVIVGGSTFASEAWRWAGGVAEPIGNLPGFNFRSTGFAVSDDGSVVVGMSGFGGDRDAFIWIDGSGMTKLDTYVAAQGIAGAAGYDLATAVGLSANGRVIVGWGFLGSDIRGWRIDLDAVVGVDETAAITPARLHAPSPNPFRSGTTIRYDLTSSAPVSLTVHDVAGRTLRTLIQRSMARGSYAVRWDGRDDQQRAVTAGVYYVRLSTPSDDRTVRVSLVP